MRHIECPPFDRRNYVYSCPQHAVIASCVERRSNRFRISRAGRSSVDNVMSAIVPYLRSEWNQVSRAFASQDPGECLEAYFTVLTWKLRRETKLPLVIEASEYLLLARVQEQHMGTLPSSDSIVPLLNPFALSASMRASYAFALSRLVTNAFALFLSKNGLSRLLGVKVVRVKQQLTAVEAGLNENCFAATYRPTRDHKPTARSTGSFVLQDNAEVRSFWIPVEHFAAYDSSIMTNS
ncbi:unnamed protein product [Soboliphyme baturini]|uniref:RNA-directed DNA polymerase n=1 Tax=Soboliphyme baturini TaxID=241478 RepID=A0A183INW7_9BILA|nr:unnamed protein product [Soboliphyme baturini]